MPKCRKCGAEIEWVLTKRGKNMPVDKGTEVSHFKTCPDAEYFSGEYHYKKEKHIQRRLGEFIKEEKK